MECARTMLTAANLPLSYWGMALHTACYIINRSPTTALDGLTPYELWTGYKPDVSNLRVFGSIAYAPIMNERRIKIQGKGQRCRMLGYLDDSKGYRLLVIEGPNKGKFINSRDVIFNETNVIDKKINTDVEEDDAVKQRHKEHLDIPATDGPVPQLEPSKDQNEPINHQIDPVQPASADNKSGEQVEEKYDFHFDGPQDQDVESSATQQFDLQPRVRSPYPQRDRRPSQKVIDQAQGKSVGAAYAYAYANLTVAEAMEDENWRAAMEEELEAHRRNGTWIVVDKSDKKSGRAPIGCKWVFTIKYQPSGEIERYKARLVAKGFTQRFGDDFNETFAPVARASSVRAILSLAATSDMSIDQFDVKTAYLNATLSEELYMTPPEGFGIDGKLCKLKKALYGLKQAAYEWNKTLDTFLKTIDLQPSTADHCIYVMRQQRNLLILVVYVDDLIIVSNNERMRVKVSQNQVYHGRLKHVDVRYHYIRKLVRNADINLVYCNSKNMLADLLTKPLQRDQFLRLRNLLGLT